MSTMARTTEEMDTEMLKRTSVLESKLALDPHKANPVAPYQAVPFSGAITKYASKAVELREPDCSLTEEVGMGGDDGLWGSDLVIELV